MKALHISPANKTLTIIDIDPDIEAWQQKIGAAMVGHQTLSMEPDLLAVVNDNGIASGLPTFTIFAPAMRNRITLAGNALVVTSDEEAFVDVTDEQVKLLDVVF